MEFFCVINLINQKRFIFCRYILFILFLGFTVVFYYWFFICFVLQRYAKHGK